MKLIVGLGNPGLEYERTRHNAGFLVIDRLVARRAPGEIPRARFHAMTIETTLPGAGKTMLMKPTTYMNRSGLSVGEAVRFYKLAPQTDLLVLVDDTAIPAGSIRVRESGGAGGHNGLADIERALGGQTWTRLRIGVGAPGPARQRDYVLGRFSEEQWAEMDPALDTAAQAAETWAAEGSTAAMNKYNERRRESSPGDGSQN